MSRPAMFFIASTISRKRKILVSKSTARQNLTVNYMSRLATFFIASTISRKQENISTKIYRKKEELNTVNYMSRLATFFIASTIFRKRNISASKSTATRNLTQSPTCPGWPRSSSPPPFLENRKFKYQNLPQGGIEHTSTTCPGWPRSSLPPQFPENGIS
jgi:hypothetical protein